MARSTYATTPIGGPGCRERIGAILWARDPRSKASRNILWFTLPMKMPRLTHTGQEKNCPPRQSGSLPPAADLREKSLPGAMSLLPAAKRWLIVGRENFPGKTCSTTDMKELLQ